MTQPLGPKQKKWIELLRSGRFRQTARYLHDDRGYCCLGVALEHVLEIEPITTQNGVRYYECAQKGMNKADLPKQAVEELGLHSRQGKMKYIPVGWEYTQEESLAELNDNGLPFDLIADIMEANPSSFFTEPK